MCTLCKYLCDLCKLCREKKKNASSWLKVDAIRTIQFTAIFNRRRLENWMDRNIKSNRIGREKHLTQLMFKIRNLYKIEWKCNRFVHLIFVQDSVILYFAIEKMKKSEICLKASANCRNECIKWTMACRRHRHWNGSLNYLSIITFNRHELRWTKSGARVLTHVQMQLWMAIK